MCQQRQAKVAITHITGEHKQRNALACALIYSTM